MNIAIDFDGTIVVHDYPNIGEIMPRAKEVINKLHEAGNKIVINSCRNGDLEMKARRFLMGNGIKFHKFNNNLDELIEKYGSDTRKISADVYIDDLNLGGFKGWDEVERILL